MPKIVLIFLVVVVCCGYSSSNAVAQIFQRFVNDLGIERLSQQNQTAVVQPVVQQPVRGFTDDRGREKFSQRNQTDILAKRGEIRTELETLKDHPWAGIYTKGLFLGAHWELYIAPQAGFVYTCRSTDQVVNGALLLIDLNYGDVIWENGIIKLKPALENDKNEANPMPTEWITITWGDRLYLVPADGIVGLCNAINAGNLGFNPFFVRGDYRNNLRQPEGLPDVPETYKPYLLIKPIEGAIITVGETREVRKRSTIIYETVVTINKGKQDGVLPGMEFFVTTPENIKIFSPIKLTKVLDTESEGIIEQGQHLSMTTGELSIIGGKLQVGRSVSTRFR